MKNIFLKIAFVIAIISLVGCAGKQCLKIGGGYAEDGKKVDGNLEYCWGEEDSKKAGEPVLTTPAGTKAILVSEADCAKIIGDASGDVVAKSVNVFARFRTFVKGK